MNKFIISILLTSYCVTTIAELSEIEKLGKQLPPKDSCKQRNAYAYIKCIKASTKKLKEIHAQIKEASETDLSVMRETLPEEVQKEYNRDSEEL